MNEDVEVNNLASSNEAQKINEWNNRKSTLVSGITTKRVNKWGYQDKRYSSNKRCLKNWYLQETQFIRWQLKALKKLCCFKQLS